MLENFYREKTFVQKMREAEIWEDIVKVKAEKRMKAGIKQNNPSTNCHQGIEKGRTRDIVAPKIGISGRTYTRAKLYI